ncbi:hypothetical protein C7B77_10000 [Chamaesiphon polymorphus CCALA 037]|uniref:Uncharacterized protein n=1 Tax=Chamaesiphon polymorphus CCALA 037 TaxID=2107692 RepID=A0A2T1GH31_9CYAN|nr:hypothetical protein C7B77_10000 [Chamaesiphon polymorphus CCALA 037]
MRFDLDLYFDRALPIVLLFFGRLRTQSLFRSGILKGIGLKPIAALTERVCDGFRSARDPALDRLNFALDWQQPRAMVFLCRSGDWSLR